MDVMALTPAFAAAAGSWPLCPYPKPAQYKGQGNTEDAADFTCQ